MSTDRQPLLSHTAGPHGISIPAAELHTLLCYSIPLLLLMIIMVCHEPWADQGACLQRSSLFYPGWVYTIPTFLLRLPFSIVEGIVWSVLVYWMVGLTPQAGRCGSSCSSHALMGHGGCLSSLHVQHCMKQAAVQT